MPHAVMCPSSPAVVVVVAVAALLSLISTSSESQNARPAYNIWHQHATSNMQIKRDQRGQHNILTPTPGIVERSKTKKIDDEFY